MDIGNKFRPKHDNTITTPEEIEVYTSKVFELSDYYIHNELLDPEDIKNKQCFNGMIKYIYNNYIITIINYDDLVLLNTLWSLYTSLCYKYKNNITIERYCLFIGITRTTFYDWINNKQRYTFSQELNCSRSDMLKKWDAEAECSMQDDAATGNPGAMFILKARRGWQETAPIQTMTQDKQRTLEQIRADRGMLTDGQAETDEEQDENVIDIPKPDF